MLIDEMIALGKEVLPDAPDDKMRQWCEEILQVVSEQDINEAMPFVKTPGGKMVLKRMLVTKFRKNYE